MSIELHQMNHTFIIICFLRTHSHMHTPTQYLLDQGADINARTLDLWCPLHSAVNWEEAGSVRTLLSRGASVNLATLSGQTAAHIAAKSSSQNPGYLLAPAISRH